MEKMKRWSDKLQHLWVQCCSWGKANLSIFHHKIKKYFTTSRLIFLQNKLKLFLRLPGLPAGSDTDDFFYYKSTPAYNKYRLDRLKYWRIFFIALFIITVNGLLLIGHPQIPDNSEVIYNLFCEFIAILAIPFTWIATIAVAFIINADFYDRSTVSEITKKDKIKFNLVKQLILMAINASEIEELCSAKKGCYLFDEQKMRCEPDYNRCDEDNADPVKEFLDDTGDDDSCRLIKYVHSEYLIMIEDIDDCFWQASIYFPELVEPINFLYKKYVKKAHRYRFIQFNYCTFFDTIKKIPFWLDNKYRKDAKFIENVKDVFQVEYEKYKNESISRSLRSAGFRLSLSIEAEAVFKPFQMFLSEGSCCSSKSIT